MRPGLRPSGAIKECKMEKARTEITSYEEDNNSIKIIKRERNIDWKNMAITVLIVIIVVFVFWYLPKTYSDKPRFENMIWISVVGALFIAISYIISSIKTCTIIDFENQEIKNCYLLIGLKIINRKLSMKNIDQISLVRFNINATYFEGPTMRRFFNISQKYALYVLYSDENYDRLIGFNNYQESRQIANKIGEKINIKIKDSSQEEFKDEDQFISSYFHYKKMVAEIKNE
jgi:hypothetical protein